MNVYMLCSFLNRERDCEANYETEIFFYTKKWGFISSIRCLAKVAVGSWPGLGLIIFIVMYGTPTAILVNQSPD